MATYCHVCGSETASNFCDYCGVAVDTSLNSTAPKKQVSQSWNQKTQARFLSGLAFVLAFIVLGVYLFRNTQPSIPVPAPSPNLSDNLENIEGDWIGTVQADDGQTYDYELLLNQSGSEISGYATTSNETGGGDAQIRGTYYNGILSLEESGGTESGDWVNGEMCYWELDLALGWGSGQAQLIGSYEGIGCDSSGTIALVRVD